MMLSKTVSLLIMIFIFSNVLQAREEPDWVKNRPLSKTHYIGIGSALKSDHPNDYRQICKDHALQDLSSEISINISSDFLIKLVEISGMPEEEVRSQVRATTQASLEGYELVDRWEDEDEYWMYYRLSKDLYHKQKEVRLKKSKSLALDLFKHARQNETKNDMASALLFYLQALDNVKGFVGEPLQADYQGRQIYLQNEILSSMQSLINKIQLVAVEAKRKASFGQPLKKPLAVRAFYTNSAGENVNLQNIPIRFSFIKGDGELVERNATNSEGIAYCQVTKIKDKTNLQLIKARLDLYGIKNDNEALLMQNILKSFSPPETKIILMVSGPSVYIQAVETHLGNLLDMKYVEPKLKKALSDYGYAFTDDMAGAELYIELKAASRKGAEVYNLFTSFVDLNISVTDMSSGGEIYKNSFEGIKGVQLDYDKAGRTALQNAGKKMEEEIIPALLSKLQK